MNANKTKRDVLLSLKASAGLPGPDLCIPVGSPIKALLRVVATNEKLISNDDIQRLTDWRNRFVTSFLTEFKATNARTKKWLEDKVGPNDKKILFMVDDINRNTFAYMGLDFINWDNGTGEVDAIVKGIEVPKGLMTLAMRTMISWAKGQLGLCQIGVRVRSDNTALHFYQKAGFEEIKHVPLRRTETENMVVWQEEPSLESAELSLVYMLYKGS